MSGSMTASLVTTFHNTLSHFNQSHLAFSGKSHPKHILGRQRPFCAAERVACPGVVEKWCAESVGAAGSWRPLAASKSPQCPQEFRKA